jgi:hypothetical protein
MMAQDRCEAKNLTGVGCQLAEGHPGAHLSLAGYTWEEKVNHPSHYGGDTVYEHIKVVEAWGLNYALGNATKYIARAGKKTANPIEDLKKAQWYIQHEIERLEKL